MGLTSDDLEVRIQGHDVKVTGRTGAVHATWTLMIDGREVNHARAEGDFTLRGRLPDSTEVEALIHQSLLGPARVSIAHGGIEVAHSRGFVA